jgi:hypothetical protein
VGIIDPFKVERLIRTLCPAQGQVFSGRGDHRFGYAPSPEAIGNTPRLFRLRRKVCRVGYGSIQNLGQRLVVKHSPMANVADHTIVRQGLVEGLLILGHGGDNGRQAQGAPLPGRRSAGPQGQIRLDLQIHQVLPGAVHGSQRALFGLLPQSFRVRIGGTNDHVHREAGELRAGKYAKGPSGLVVGVRAAVEDQYPSDRTPSGPNELTGPSIFRSQQRIAGTTQANCRLRNERRIARRGLRKVVLIDQ